MIRLGMRDNVFNVVGGCSTVIAVPLNLFAWVVANNINILLAIIVSILSIIYIFIKIVDKISDMRYKYKKRIKIKQLKIKKDEK